MKIYTKQGDRGQTKLGNGVQLGKDELVVEALGTIDELNNALGYAIAQHKVEKTILEKIQGELLSIGAELSLSKSKYVNIQEDINSLEQNIDLFEEKLPKLVNFILPGGSASSAWIHCCRGVCRRAERCLVAMVHDGCIDNLKLITYLNRLSDFLFCLARWENVFYNIEDVIWKSPKHEE